MEVPTLPGHGVTLNLANVSAESWMMEAELAMRKLKEKSTASSWSAFQWVANRDVSFASLSNR